MQNEVNVRRMSEGFGFGFGFGFGLEKSQRAQNVCSRNNTVMGSSCVGPILGTYTWDLCVGVGKRCQRIHHRYAKT